MNKPPLKIQPEIIAIKPKVQIERKPIIPAPTIIQRKIPGANEAGKVVMHPKVVVVRRDKGSYGEVSSLFSSPDIIKKAQPTTSTPMMQSSMKEFMHLKMNKQISVQTHSSVSEIASENLEMLESIVKDDLNTPISSSQSMMHGNAAIPTIVKMLENPNNDLMMDMMGQEGENMSMDLNIDGLPEDLLQHVAELAENKEIQDIIDKQVLGVQNMGMSNSMVGMNVLGNASQLMAPMNVIVQEIVQPKVLSEFQDNTY